MKINSNQTPTSYDEMVYIDRILKLLPECTDGQFFIYQGCVYMGNRVEALKRFCTQTMYPSDLHVWLQDNYTEYKPLKP